MPRRTLVFMGIGVAAAGAAATAADAAADAARRPALIAEAGDRTIGGDSYDYGGAGASSLGIGVELPRGAIIWSTTLRRTTFDDSNRVDLSLGVSGRIELGQDRLRGRVRLGGGVDRAAPGDSDILAHRWFAELGLGLVFDLSDDTRLFGELVEGKAWLDQVDGQDVYQRYVPIPGDERHRELRVGVGFLL